MSGVIAIKNKGQLLPIDWLGKAVLAFPSAIGLAAETEGVIQVLRTNDPAQITVDTINNMQETFKDDIVTLYLNKTAGAIKPEDMQPYVLLENEDKTPALVAFLDGDFSLYRVANSPFSDEYHCVTTHLTPKILQLAQLCEGDLEKLLKNLDTDFMRKEFAGMWKDKGTITLLSDLGVAPMSFAVNPLKREYVYGWVSNALLDDAKDTTLPLGVVARGKTLAASLVGKLGAAPTKEPAPVEKPVTATAAAPSQMWHPPSNLHGKPLKAEYRRVMRILTGVNELPEGWNERVGIPIPPGKSVDGGGPIKSLSDLPAVAGNTTLAPAATTKDQVQTDGDAVLSPQVIEALEDEFATKFDYTKSVKDMSNANIPDPNVMPAMENKEPPAWKQIGLDMESLFRLKKTDWLYLAQKYPGFSALVNLNLMGIYLNSLAKEPAKPAAQPETVKGKTLSLAKAG